MTDSASSALAHSQSEPAQPVAKKREMIENIHALRGISAGMVVLWHAAPNLKTAGVDTAWLRFCTTGLYLFFVISGFMMVYMTRPGLTPGNFVANRFTRIVPFYWAATLFVFLLATVLPQLFQNTDPSFSNLLKSLFFVPYEKPNGLIQPIVFVGWTLNIEMPFYAIDAIGLFMRGHWGIWFTVGVVSLFGLTQPWADSVAHRFYTNPIIYGLVAGMLVALVRDRFTDARFGFALIALGSVITFGEAWLEEPLGRMRHHCGGADPVGRRCGRKGRFPHHLPALDRRDLLFHLPDPFLCHAGLYRCGGQAGGLAASGTGLLYRGECAGAGQRAPFRMGTWESHKTRAGPALSDRSGGSQPPRPAFRAVAGGQSRRADPGAGNPYRHAV